MRGRWGVTTVEFVGFRRINENSSNDVMVMAAFPEYTKNGIYHFKKNFMIWFIHQLIIHIRFLKDQSKLIVKGSVKNIFFVF